MSPVPELLSEFPSTVARTTQHPLTDGRYHRLLEASGCVSSATGWTPAHLKLGAELLPGYLKTHSYGEFIFDWAWADFYHRHGVSYYPKLLHALPFTPVNAPKFLAANRAALAEASLEWYLQRPEISGEHYLFITPEDARLLTGLGFAILQTHQFHWVNRYRDFDEYLARLSKNRRRMIQKERRRVAESGLTVRFLSRSELTVERRRRLHELYLTTIDKKDSQAYLTAAFFERLPEELGESLLVVGAFEAQELVAMALFFTSPQCLYGRYWGIDPRLEERLAFLHFELCYYQGMEHCLAQQIPLFEAGAQGEHKLWRGFEPVTILSAHHLRDERFFAPVRAHIGEQNRQHAELCAHYRTFLPF